MLKPKLLQKWASAIAHTAGSCAIARQGMRAGWEVVGTVPGSSLRPGSYLSPVWPSPQGGGSGGPSPALIDQVPIQTTPAAPERQNNAGQPNVAIINEPRIRATT